MFWWLMLILFALFIYMKFWKPLNFWEEQGVPFLKPTLFFGNMMPLILKQMSFFDLIDQYYNSMKARYVGIYQFTQPILIIRDVELAKQICIKDFDHFVDHKSFFNETDEPVFSSNLFAAKGKTWRDLRATMSPAFTGSKMRSMFILISNCAERFSNHFVKSAHGNAIQELEIKEIFRRFTIDVIGTCVFGIESDSLEDKNNDFYLVGKDVGDFTGLKGLKSMGFIICPGLMRALKIGFFSKKEIDFFCNIVSKTIAFREKNGVVRPDIIQIMMQARKGQLKHDDFTKYNDTGFATIEESEVGRNANVNLDITDELIVAQSMVFFLGGTDTVSSVLSFAAYELAINMDIQKKLQNEIDETFAECDGKISYEQVAKMKYLDMVVSESLRKWPQAFLLDRLCEKDYEVKPAYPGEDPFVIKKGTVIWVPCVGYHHDHRYFPNPERFDPERFSEENKNKISPYFYIPFGQGPRSCIGNRFALLIAKTALVHLLHKFSIVVTQKTDIPLKLATSNIMVHPINGFWLGLQKRKN